MALWNWLVRRRPSPLASLDVVLYTRVGCHLCDDAWAFLKAEQAKRGFHLRSADVDGSPALAAQFGNEVPVVLVNGQVRFRGRVNRVLWDRLVRAESARPV